MNRVGDGNWEASYSHCTMLKMMHSTGWEPQRLWDEIN